MTKRMPAVFVGHGSPMLALAHDGETRELRRIGDDVIAAHGKPKAILAISAHWYTNYTNVQTDEHPKQIYDMYGFPDELYEVDYPAAGSPELGRAVLDLPGLRVQENNQWGIDHGVWTPLVHMFPHADIPIAEFSVSRQLDARESYEVGRKLAALRDEGYLVLGSGNVVHNLRAVEWDNPHGTPMADAFDNAVRTAVQARDDEAVLAYEKLPHAAYAVPTPDHFLPLAYVLGASQGEKPQVFNNIRNLGSISITGYAFGL